MGLKKATPCHRETYVTLEQRYAQLITTVYQYPHQRPTDNEDTKPPFRSQHR